MKFKYLLLLALLVLTSQAGAQTVPLGTAGNFAVLGFSTVTSTGATSIVGNVGVSPQSSVTGFPPGVVTKGAIHRADPAAAQARADLTVAYNALVALTPTQQLTGQDLGGLTLTPGIYHFNTSAQLTGTLTLDAQNDPTAVFIFQIGSTLTTAPNSAVVLINGALGGNVYWQIGSSATLNTGTAFKGNIVAYTTITVSHGVTLLPGRALAENGAVTLDTNSITTVGEPVILFQNSVTNQVSFWYMHGTTRYGVAATATIPAAGWALRGTGDFNGDGSPDLVFQNTTTGKIAVWFMNGSTYLGGQLLPYVPSAGYQVVGVSDFNGDFSPDLVFQNASTRKIAVWYFSGTTLIGSESTQAVPSAGYLVAGVGDFNGDGAPDLVFQNSSTGAVVFWYMSGAQLQSGSAASAFPSSSYKVVGVNDYNGDGISDLLFQNTTTGQLVFWYINGSTVIGGEAVGAMPDANSVAVGPR
jgi:hypothetical protein